jgi:hypothetical protein
MTQLVPSASTGDLERPSASLGHHLHLDVPRRMIAEVKAVAGRLQSKERFPQSAPEK